MATGIFPPEIWLSAIGPYLAKQSLCQLSQTSKSMHDIATNDSLWNRHYIKAYAKHRNFMAYTTFKYHNTCETDGYSVGELYNESNYWYSAQTGAHSCKNKLICVNRAHFYPQFELKILPYYEHNRYVYIGTIKRAWKLQRQMRQKRNADMAGLPALGHTPFDNNVRC
jgi:hypothetical protein